MAHTSTTATAAPAASTFKPYVSAAESPAEFTAKAVVLGMLFGLIFGASTVYLGLRAVTEEEHGVLPYPEGSACADVLVAGERGGALARTVFQGLGVGVVWKALSWIFQIFPTAVGYTVARAGVFPNATLNLDLSPEYMGVGYVIGPRIAGVMFAGGVLSWLVLLPLLSILGNYLTVPLPPIHPNYANNPATGRPFLISEMGPTQLWSAYIRYIGAGAVLASGLITLARTFPTIIGSAREGLKGFVSAASAAGQERTERDMRRSVVLIGCVVLAVFLTVAPRMPTQGNILAALLIVIFGFFFATVSSRITGLIGSSSNPISGMPISTPILP